MAERTQEVEKLSMALIPLLEGVGLELVELTVSRHGESVRIKAIVYSPNGTGTDECSAAHRLLYPRLQVLLGVQELSIEVSSPGIERIIRTGREWGIFAGKAVRYLLKDGDWRYGTIVSSEGGKVVISGEDHSQQSIAISEILKARLDPSREGV